MTEADVHKLKATLRAEAEKKYPGDTAQQDAYIFGTLRRLGWKPKREQADDEGDHEYR